MVSDLHLTSYYKILYCINIGITFIEIIFKIYNMILKVVILF